ncbi:MAG TPA: TonB-dependent receptor, partial [Puia sp.]|nr:TonB-dependent receptor [Puia sp.]
MRNLIALFFCVMLAAVVQAQSITGIIKDEQGKPASGASVALKKIIDSSQVKVGLSGSKGQFEFKDIPSGKYFVTVSFVGFASANSPAFDFVANGTLSLPEIKLKKAASNLKEVVVTSRKPLVEVKADKIVVNVENSVNAVGQDALELLRKSPGVMVDKDDNLSLSGKNGVQVYVDGRPTPLSGKDLSEYLKTIQSSSIESIELITNPSAKYEAAGNAGIINIRLKK